MDRISYKGVEYHSPNPVSEDLLCTICHELLDQPQQTTHCGHLFCKKCLVALVGENVPQNVAQVGRGSLYEHPVTCPTCRTACDGWFEDKNAERKVKNVKVFCTNNSCEWEGSLCHLDDHKAGRGCEGCRYQPIPCTLGCGEEVIRKDLEHHKQNTCVLRPKNCEYCQWLGTHKSMNTHYSECRKYPIPCPNNCGKKDIPVQEVEGHLQECPEQEIECTHSDLGCKEVFKRRTSEDHYENFKDVHNCLLRSRVTLLTQVVVQLLQDKDESTSSSASSQSNTLSLVNRPWLENESTSSSVSSQASTLSLLSRPWLENTKLFPSMPWIICFDQFSKRKIQNGVRWTSDMFFTTGTGYKLCFLVYAGGNSQDVKDHISVYTALQRGPNDDILSWPFDKTVEVTLLNQLEDRYHHSKLISFKNGSSECIWIKRGKEAATGWGIPKFIPYWDLNKSQIRNCQYLRDDCLFFKIELK